MIAPRDAKARAQALDPAGSYIVQAPAGSGKTALLVGRFLALLGCVSRPEKILALTFTRKAASEMRARIGQALSHAASLHAAGQPVAAEDTLGALALSAVQHAERNGWELMRSLDQLRVMTLDSFNSELVRQMPLGEGASAQSEVLSWPDGLYQRAIERAIVDAEGHYWEALQVLLRHFDYRVDHLSNQLLTMLRSREQWLDWVVGDGERTQAERAERLCQALTVQLGHTLLAVREQMPDGLLRALLPLARFSAEQRHQAGDDTVCEQLLDIQCLPDDDLAHLPSWQALANLLLTRSGKFRKRVDKSLGFLPAHKAEKQAMTELLERFEAQVPTLAESLHRVHLFEAEPDWQLDILSAFCQLLRLMVAQLRVEFAEHDCNDFIENALHVLQVLGDDESPSDLALTLDARIEHILVDEFQDTSAVQFELLRRLVRDWTAGDGRSLFLVGDPMQSIYRFRRADVSLFVRACEQGIGPVRLHKLSLLHNFRARPELIDWINDAFASIFHDSAITYSPCLPGTERSAPVPAGVHLHACYAAGDELAGIIAQVQACTAQQQQVGILVRSRSHLSEIARALRTAGIAYRGEESERLLSRPVVQDLLSLTCALSNPADNLAWLCVLRAPWCGLSLAQLSALVPAGRDRCLSECVLDAQADAQLDADGRLRLGRLRTVLASVYAGRGGVALARQVEWSWQRLGGAACLIDESDLSLAEQFFVELERLVQSGGDIEQFKQRLQGLTASVDSRTDDANTCAQVELMTVHKSKGLEFDVVILPALERTTRPSDTPPILWRHDRDGLLMAPVKPSDAKQQGGVYQLLQMLDKRETEDERKRLLYVAATRARVALHLFARARHDEKNGWQARTGTLLALLWRQFEPHFVEPPSADEQAPIQAAAEHPLYRLPAKWQLPLSLPTLPLGEPCADKLFAGLGGNSLIRAVGTVVHRYLKQIADEGLALWPAERLPGLESAMALVLREEVSLDEAQIAEGCALCLQALGRVLGDERGRWLLGAHEAAHSEWAISGIVAGQVVHRIIDRTLVAEDVRWIVDYKVTVEGGADIAKMQQTYSAQLDGYAQLVRQLDSRPIRCALYLPLTAQWCEWGFLLSDATDDR